MKKFYKAARAVAAITICALLLFSTGAFSLVQAVESVEDLRNQYDNIEKQIEANEKKLQNIKTDISNNESYLSALNEQKDAIYAQLDGINSQISLLNKEISALDTSIAVLEKEIVSFNAEIAQIEHEITAKGELIEETKQVFLQRLRASYITGDATSLEVILDAGDFSSSLIKQEMLTRIKESDDELIQILTEENAKLETLVIAVEAKRSEVIKKQNTVKEDREAVVVKRADLNSKQSTLASKERDARSKASSISSLISRLDSSSALYKSQLNKYYSERDEIEREIDDIIRREGSSVGDSPGDKGIVNDGKMMWPVPDRRCYISAGFAWYKPFADRDGKFHEAIDIGIRASTRAEKVGTKIVAAQGGKVISTGYRSQDAGNFITIDHGNGTHTFYCHLDRIFVKTGQVVEKGYHIAAMGDTGKVTGPHLHFAVKVKSSNGSMKAVNPLNYVSYPY